MKNLKAYAYDGYHKLTANVYQNGASLIAPESGSYYLYGLVQFLAEAGALRAETYISLTNLNTTEEDYYHTYMGSAGEPSGSLGLTLSMIVYANKGDVLVVRGKATESGHNIGNSVIRYMKLIL